MLTFLKRMFTCSKCKKKEKSRRRRKTLKRKLNGG